MEKRARNINAPVYTTKPLTDKQKQKMAADNKKRTNNKAKALAEKQRIALEQLKPFGLADTDDEDLHLELGGLADTDDEDLQKEAVVTVEHEKVTVEILDEDDDDTPLIELASKKIPLKVPTINPWKYTRNAGKYRRVNKNVSSAGDMDTVIRTKWPKTVVTHNDETNCTVCGMMGDHKMRSILRECSCKIPECNLR